MRPNPHPLDDLHRSLCAIVAARDGEALARYLRGYDLPALGGHQSPAEILLQALYRPASTPDLAAGLGRLLGKVLTEAAARGQEEAHPRLSSEQEDLFAHGLLLAADLPPERALGAAIQALPQKLHEHESEIPNRPPFSTLLRRAQISQQVDDSLEEHWLAQMSEVGASTGESLTAEERTVLMDAWRGLLWIPPSEKEKEAGKVISAERIHRGLTHLEAALGQREETLAILERAFQVLEETFPRSATFWKETLAAWIPLWPDDLQRAISDAWRNSATYSSTHEAGRVVDFPISGTPVRERAAEMDAAHGSQWATVESSKTSARGVRRVLLLLTGGASVFYGVFGAVLGILMERSGKGAELGWGAVEVAALSAAIGVPVSILLFRPMLMRALRPREQRRQERLAPRSAESDSDPDSKEVSTVQARRAM